MAKTRKTFSWSTKQAAVAEVEAGELKQKDIADKYGCSVPALQLWRKEIRNGNAPEEETWETEEEAEETLVPVKKAKKGKRTKKAVKAAKASIPCEAECKCAESNGDAQKVMKAFWGKNNRAVNMLFSPKDMSGEEVFKFVNEAIQFACDSK